MKMSEERRNEIAWKVLIHKVKKQGIPHLKPNEFNREVVNNAKEIGIRPAEAMEFSRALILPLVQEMFVSKELTD